MLLSRLDPYRGDRLRLVCRVMVLTMCLWLRPWVPVWGREPAAPPEVLVVLWFDTEDYILPASDDAALRIARFLTEEGIRATFKVVGEKARTLERRGRTDVIAALKRHEIGYHANTHSQEPSPAVYCSVLGWDLGVNEFDRREGPGVRDVRRIFGVLPTCYGQPGSSWAPQSFGALVRWGIPIYLDEGRQVGLDGRPFWYGRTFNLFHLSTTIRCKLTGPDALDQGRQQFRRTYDRLIAAGGGVISTYYHPCEFIHEEFWDGVNFRRGANPPREQWKLPRMKTARDAETAFQTFEAYVRFMKTFPHVRFGTASEAWQLYGGGRPPRRFGPAELAAIAGRVGDEITFQTNGPDTLAASEILALLNQYVVDRLKGPRGGTWELAETPFGPTHAGPAGFEPGPVDASQFARTAADVASYLRFEHRVPGTVWLGSRPIPPESYLMALARVMPRLMADGRLPDPVDIPRARLAAADAVAPDRPGLWGWVVFPPGFHAPAMMALAKLQAWTLKPAIRGGAAVRRARPAVDQGKRQNRAGNAQAPVGDSSGTR